MTAEPAGPDTDCFCFSPSIKVKDQGGTLELAVTRQKPVSAVLLPVAIGSQILIGFLTLAGVVSPGVAAFATLGLCFPIGAMIYFDALDHRSRFGSSHPILQRSAQLSAYAVTLDGQAFAMQQVQALAFTVNRLPPAQSLTIALHVLVGGVVMEIDRWEIDPGSSLRAREITETARALARRLGLPPDAPRLVSATLVSRSIPIGGPEPRIFLGSLGFVPAFLCALGSLILSRDPSNLLKSALLGVCTGLFHLLAWNTMVRGARNLTELSRQAICTQLQKGSGKTLEQMLEQIRTRE